MPDAILITGANGHIGQHLIRALTNSQYTIIGLSIEGRAASNQRGLTYVSADICDRPRMERVFEEYRPVVVIHLAALAHGKPGQFGWSDYVRVNYVASRQLFELAITYGVKRLLFASTAEVYGIPSCEGPISEDAPCSAESEYARSKLLAEDALRTLGGDPEFAYAVLRFAPVYAHDFRLNLDKRLYLKAPNVAYYFRDGAYRLGLCSLKNIEYFVKTWLAHEQPMSGTFNLADHQTYSVKDLLALERLHHRARLQIRLPYLPALLSICGIEALRSALRKPPNMLTAYNLRKLVRSSVWDVSRAEAAVGKLPYDVEDSLYLTEEDSR